MTTRSTTGCINCKTRRKKCDETHPRCQRCTKSGIECKYEYVEAGVGRHIKRRTRPAPRPASELAKALQLPAPIIHTPRSSDIPSTRASILPTPSSSNLDYLLDGWPNDLDLAFPGYGFDFSLPPDTDWHSSLQAPLYLATPPPSTPPNLELTSGQASLFQALFSLAQPEDVSSTQPTPQLDFSREPSRDDWDTSEDDDPEGVRQLVCVSPVMDASVASNALAYVLQNYATWVMYAVYDPLRMVKQMKECIIGQFYSSEEARSRIMLISNVMKGLNKSVAIDTAGYSLVSTMYTRIRRTIALFMSTPPSPFPDVDRRNASRALDNTLEVIGIQLFYGSMVSVITLMQEAAPVFRRGCPEPPGQPVNLADILLEPGINLRHFAVLDVAFSVTTGRPMLCRYHVDFSLELCEEMMRQCECYGLQWLHGLPNQYVLLFAWMNTLKERYGDRVGEEYIAKIEADLNDLRIAPSEGTDPALRIARMVVQECWRQAVYIYFYMALCGAPATDPRVEKALKGFMRLVHGTQPGRNPDAFLLVPGIIAGVAMTRQRDRETIRRRLSVLAECATPGTCGHEALEGMEDIWARVTVPGVDSVFLPPHRAAPWPREAVQAVVPAISDRHKKCDETRPKCQRCTKSGVECGGYERDPKPRRKIRPEPSGLDGAAALPAQLEPIADPAAEFKSLAESVGIGLTEPPFDFSMPVDDTWHPSLQQTLPPPINIEIIDLTAPEPPMPGPSKPSGLEVPRRSRLSSGQASLYQALFSLAQPDQASPLACSSPASSIPSLSPWPSPNTDRDNASDTDEDDDPEGARYIWCTAPVMDSCVVSNSLPYVLQSYANWLNYTTFEPLRLVYPTRECVIAKFASSEDARSRIILIANAMAMLRRAANPQGVPLVSKLASRVQHTVALFKSSSRSNVPDVDQRNARSALDNIVEIMGITLYSSPLSSVIQLMQDAAPVFRCACPEPLTQLVSLPDLLLGPWVHLRYFSVTDVTLSITTGRPMFFRYDVEFSLELYEKMEQRKTNFGLTWMHGMPDPLVLLFAWMNNLREEGNISEELVARIEQDVQDLKIVPGNATDPALKVGRLVVQECWRQAVYIYLYMALCGVPADDPRVKKAVKTFMRLVNGTSPGRNPDAFLVVPGIIAGVAATRPRDRDTLRTRLAALPECKPGTCRHDSLLMLDDVWSRSRAQARAAVWSDLRLGCLRISGM